MMSIRLTGNLFNRRCTICAVGGVIGIILVKKNIKDAALNIRIELDISAQNGRTRYASVIDGIHGRFEHGSIGNT